MQFLASVIIFYDYINSFYVKHLELSLYMKCDPGPQNQS